MYCVGGNEMNYYIEYFIDLYKKYLQFIIFFIIIFLIVYDMKKGVYIILKGCYKDFFYIIGRFVFVCSIYILKIFFNGFDLYY